MLEAARLGAALPLAADIDGRLVFRTSVYIDRRITPVLLPPGVPVFESRAEFDELTPGFVVGWQSRGQRREGIGLGTALNMFTLRFDSPATAQAAADLIAARLQSKGPGDPVSIPDFADARAQWSAQYRRVDAQFVYGSMLLLVRAEDPVSEPAEPTASAALAQRAFRAIIDGLAEYTPTPVDQFGSLPIDTEAMLSRTLPLEDAGQFSQGTDPSMVLTRQAWLHSAFRADKAKAAYTDAEVDLVAISGAALYRAVDTRAAARLVAALIDAETAHYTPIDSPPNMPGTPCFDRKDPKSSAERYPPTCFLRSGRYVAVVEGDNPQHVYQQTAAQYRLLVEG